MTLVYRSDGVAGRLRGEALQHSPLTDDLFHGAHGVITEIPLFNEARGD